jgi:hypothetical protein
VVVHTCKPSYSGGRDERLKLEASQATFARPHLKTKSKLKGCGWLKWPGSCLALGSISNPPTQECARDELPVLVQRPQRGWESERDLTKQEPAPATRAGALVQSP